MKFLCTQFPNITVSGSGVSLKFTDGSYSTEDPREIELLKTCGFPFEEEAKEEVKELAPAKKTRKK